MCPFLRPIAKSIFERNVDAPFQQKCSPKCDKSSVCDQCGRAHAADWQLNDGLVPLQSQRAPCGAPWSTVTLDGLASMNPGKWNVCHVEGDHLHLMLANAEL